MNLKQIAWTSFELKVLRNFCNLFVSSVYAHRINFQFLSVYCFVNSLYTLFTFFVYLFYFPIFVLSFFLEMFCNFLCVYGLYSVYSIFDHGGVRMTVVIFFPTVTSRKNKGWSARLMTTYARFLYSK